MTAAQRMEQAQRWRTWTARAQQAIGALLAETVDETPALDGNVFECVNKLIEVEQILTGVIGK